METTSRGAESPLWEPVAFALIAGLVLGAFVFVPMCDGTGDARARLEVTRLFVGQAIRPSMDSFRMHTGRYPTTAEGLRALIVPPAKLAALWHGPYVNPDVDVTRDHWGRAYLYRSPGMHNPESYDLWSLGPDGVESADDIGNW